MNRVAVHLYTLCTIQALLRHAMGDEKYSVGNARGLLTPSSVILEMQINLLSPFQTSPAAVHFRAHPEAAGHVIPLLLEAGKGQFAVESVTLKRFGSSIVHLLFVVIEIKSVPKVLLTRLTPETAWWGWRRRSTSLPSSPWLNHNLGLYWNQEVALISRLDSTLDSILQPQAQLKHKAQFKFATYMRTCISGWRHMLGKSEL